MKSASNKESPLYMRLSVNPYAIALLALILLVIPALASNSFLSGKEPYLIQRLAEDFNEKGIQKTDELSYSGRVYVYPLGTIFIISGVERFLGEKAFIILPVILGALSIFLFYLIIKKEFSNELLAAISSVILLSSPSFIYTFSSITMFTLPFFLIILGFYTLQKPGLNPLSCIIFVSTAFFGIQQAVISVAILIIMYKKETRVYHLLSIAAIIAILAFFYLPSFAQYGFPEIPDFESRNPLFNLFSDLGSNFGISLFLVFLAFFGLKRIWKEKYAHLRIYFGLLAVILLLFIGASFVIYSALILAPLAAAGILYLWSSNWESQIIKDLTILILILGLLFSSVSFINDFKNIEPSEEKINSLLFIKENTPKESVVLSHHSYGIWINSIASRKNVIDDYQLYAPEINQRYQDTQEIFSSRNLEKTKSLLNKYSINYIYLTKEMKQGTVWQSEEQGLLFVLKFSNQDFTKIYDKEGNEVWKVVR